MNYTRLTDKRLVIPKNAFRQSKSKEEYIELSRVAYKTDNTEIYNRLAELEDKIEQGTLIELPCKVGDTVYKVEREYGYSNDTYFWNIVEKPFELGMLDYLFGKMIFLTRSNPS